MRWNDEESYINGWMNGWDKMDEIRWIDGWDKMDGWNVKERLIVTLDIILIRVTEYTASLHKTYVCI